MKGRGGGCIARYPGGRGGRGGGIYDLSKVDMIMLKFRPIAPKPVTAGSGSGASTTDNSDVYVRCGRGKRRYVRVNGNKNKDDSKRFSARKRKLSASSTTPPSPPSKSVSGGGDEVVTLSLLPETPDRKENSPVSGSPSGNSDLLSSVQTPRARKCYNNKSSASEPVWLSFNNKQQSVCYGDVRGGDAVVMVAAPPPRRRAQVVSYVTVECVTDTWVNATEVLGCTDKERMMNMERDTCPWFISDGQDGVVWTNKAYRQMAGVGDEEMAVMLVRKDKWTSPAPVTYPAFTCKVRVTSEPYCHRTTSWPSSSTLTLPCDVWRMAGCGYAWRLDVKAALSLGR